MTTEKIFPNDTQWAIAAKVPIEVLEAVRRRLPKWLRGRGSKVVSGGEGFAALVVFGGSPDVADTSARALSTEHRTAVFVLDFDDEAPQITELDGTTERHRRGYPADFLADRGVIAPGYEPTEPSQIVAVGVVDGTTVREARRVGPKGNFEIVANSRGVAIEDVSGMITGWIGGELGRTSYTLFLDPDGTYSCVVSEPGKEEVSFGRPSPNWPAADSVLGETTLDGIVRVLDIPRRLLERKS